MPFFGFVDRTDKLCHGWYVTLSGGDVELMLQHAEYAIQVGLRGFLSAWSVIGCVDCGLHFSDVGIGGGSTEAEAGADHGGHCGVASAGLKPSTDDRVPLLYFWGRCHCSHLPKVGVRETAGFHSVGTFRLNPTTKEGKIRKIGILGQTGIPGLDRLTGCRIVCSTV